MGYCTYHQLDVTDKELRSVPDDERVRIVAELLKSCDGAKYALDEQGWEAGPAKWFDHDLDMCRFSMNHPERIFVLSGEGEDSGDLWKAYYVNGRFQHCQVELKYQPFNWAELREPETPTAAMQTASA